MNDKIERIPKTGQSRREFRLNKMENMFRIKNLSNDKIKPTLNDSVDSQSRNTSKYSQ
jgi:hypothetical protein